MPSLVFGNNFLSSTKKLDRTLAVKINNTFKLLEKNPWQTKLHTKPLHGKLKGIYSLRIGRNYRLLFMFIASDQIMLLKVAHRKDIYQ